MPEHTRTRASRVLIVGVSTRAIAESAARAGYAVTTVDAFGDLDQRARVPNVSLARDLGVRYGARAVVRAARDVECDAVAYVAGFENHPALVRELAAGRELWGNRPEVLALVRHPIALARALARRGFAVPAVRASAPGEGSGVARDEGADGVSGGSDGGAGAGAPPQIHDAADSIGVRHPFDARRGDPAPSGAATVPSEPPSDAARRWLLKRRRSGGGHGVREWSDGHPVSRASYLQERIVGAAGSVVFAGDGARAVPLAVSRQLVGDPAFGTGGFRYCGSILARAGDAQMGDAGDVDDDALVARAYALASAVVEEFGLVGVGGVDFVARDSVPYPVEVNPRYSASMELAERAYGLSIFDVHARACAGALPQFDLVSARRGAPGAVGKAILYARHDVVLGDTRAWLKDDSVRDVPHPGERIPRGRPVCTVFARGRDGGECYEALVSRAEVVYEQLHRRRPLPPVAALVALEASVGARGTGQ